MTVRKNVIPWAPAALVLAALLVAGCAGKEDNPPTTSGGSAKPHGYVEGAKEAAEQQSRLLLNDPGSGRTRVLDLITGEVHKTADRKGVQRLATDGRFGFLHAAGSTHVLDSGAWMVDHGDHVHYYRAALRDLGQLPVGKGAQVRGEAAVSVVTGGDGKAALYDRATWEKGRITAPRTLPGTYEGVVVPHDERLLAFEKKGGGTRLAVLDRKGRQAAAPAATCERPRGDAVTRRGAVFGCADGALLVGEKDGEVTAEKIPYDAEVPEAERATAFRQRPGSDTLTARAGAKAVWVLDAGERSWKRVETGPVVAANTAGEGAPLLVLEQDGALHGYDIGTGKETAKTKRLLTGDAHKDGSGEGGGPVIEVDRSRAYVNDAGGKRVHEVDYNDDLRLARSFDLDLAPVLMAETGR